MKNFNKIKSYRSVIVIYFGVSVTPSIYANYLSKYGNN